MCYHYTICYSIHCTLGGYAHGSHLSLPRHQFTNEDSMASRSQLCRLLDVMLTFTSFMRYAAGRVGRDA